MGLCCKKDRVVLSEDANHTGTKLSDHFNYKLSTPTLPAPPEIHGISFPTGTPVIPGLLPGMTAIPTVPGQDLAAENAKLFALDSQNPNREIEGALIETNFKSTIGVLLDDFSESFGIREKVANYYLGQNNDFWIKKAQMQTKFTERRQNHRAYYYFNKKQLPIPPEQVWEFNLSKAYRTKTGDHDYIAVDGDFYSVLVTDTKNINRSEPVLNIIGGKWSDYWILPVDPEFLLQRTGYACVSRKSLTIDSENIWAYYNDFCETKQPQPTSEHPAICCVDELNQKVGSVNVTITWHRIPYTENIAKNYRFGNHISALSDLAGVHKNLLEETRVAYRYYGRNSCELHEQCIGASGWRRLLRFTTTSLNSGKADIHIGNVTDYLSHGIFEWDNCHKHFHYQHYANFFYDQAPGHKMGFCLQSSRRYFNTEYTFLNSLYDTCSYQGISAGWGDDYRAGLSCQWVDVTGLPAQTALLGYDLNPDGFLCEGSLVLNDSNAIQWELTNFTTSYGYPVSRAKCNFINNWDANNYESINYTLHNNLSFVTEPCTRSQSGPLRDCGFQVQNNAIECTPGENVTLGFYLRESKQTPSVTVRICESSRVLGSSTHCEYIYALANTIVELSSSESNPATVTFQCPIGRDYIETGGLYSILVAPTFIEDEFMFVNIVK
ncbi:Lysyl oxidase [Gigaspora margarita]|uniref:Lysyl oxidase n=1 Tax=Gigaspora margarita TaxID=4874 RepID=A0A8H4A6V3_GIGMA|nr:Lysyl oxidase [Gigaspora margarita]